MVELGRVVRVGEGGQLMHIINREGFGGKVRGKRRSGHIVWDN